MDRKVPYLVLVPFIAPIACSSRQKGGTVGCVPVKNFISNTMNLRRTSPLRSFKLCGTLMGGIASSVYWFVFWFGGPENLQRAALPIPAPFRRFQPLGRQKVSHQTTSFYSTEGCQPLLHPPSPKGHCWNGDRPIEGMGDCLLLRVQPAELAEGFIDDHPHTDR